MLSRSWSLLAKGITISESRIKSYRFECWNGVNWTTLATGEKPMPTTIHRISRV